MTREFDPKQGHCAPQERVVDFKVDGVEPLGPDRFAFFERRFARLAIVDAQARSP